MGIVSRCLDQYAEVFFWIRQAILAVQTKGAYNGGLFAALATGYPYWVVPVGLRFPAGSCRTY